MPRRTTTSTATGDRTSSAIATPAITAATTPVPICRIRKSCTVRRVRIAGLQQQPLQAVVARLPLDCRSVPPRQRLQRREEQSAEHTRRRRRPTRVRHVRRVAEGRARHERVRPHARPQPRASAARRARRSAAAPRPTAIAAIDREPGHATLRLLGNTRGSSGSRPSRPRTTTPIAEQTGAEEQRHHAAAGLVERRGTRPAAPSSATRTSHGSTTTARALMRISRPSVSSSSSSLRSFVVASTRSSRIVRTIGPAALVREDQHLEDRGRSSGRPAPPSRSRAPAPVPRTRARSGNRAKASAAASADRARERGRRPGRANDPPRSTRGDRGARPATPRARRACGRSAGVRSTHAGAARP